MTRPLAVLLLLLLTVVLAPGALTIDDDDDQTGPPDLCAEPIIGIAAAPYLNGLPLIEENLEIVGDAVKVMVETPFLCHTVTPPSLPYRWQVTGPDGPVVLTSEETLRPRFRATVAGAYEARITYCPQTCQNVTAGSTTVDIPPQSARFDFIVVNEIPLPPDTEPQLNSWAQQEGAINWVDTDHAVRRTKCGFPDSDWFTPQVVPVRPWLSQSSYRLLEGKVMGSRIAGEDNELNHYSHDAIVHVAPDRRYAKLMVPAENGVEKKDMEVEWESNYFPGPKRPLPGDRISAFGFHTYDCHHSDETFGILTEIHPPVLTAVHRKRPIQIPDGWGGLGTNIHVPGIITDIWANKRAGEMSSNCSTTGLHQQAQIAPPPLYVRMGSCIKSPHPLDRQFVFNVYLPPNPQDRMAAAGISAPPAPLYVSFPLDGHLTVVPTISGGVTSLTVTVDLIGYSPQEYSARIVAGWVQPSPDNWGLQRWKVGIPAIDILDDHDDLPFDDGDWVFWAAINNRDQEWTRLLNGGAVTGLQTFDDRPFETESPYADRGLGPHVLLFHPRFVDFPGLPGEDLNRSLLIHSSGYDAELDDDPTGVVNHILNVGAWSAPIGWRHNAWMISDTGDYFLNYFVERLGPVSPNLTAAGQALVAAYSLRPAQARCSGTPACVLFPERNVETAWHPIQARLGLRDAELDWRDFPSFEPQEPEELGFTGISFGALGASLARTRAIDPRRAERFFVELRQQFDGVRGTAMFGEFGKSLPGLEAALPADLWQLHFGDIDPTPVDLAVQWVRLAPANPVAGQEVVVSAQIVNNGTGAAAGFSVQSYRDGTAARAVQVPGLAPGAATSVTFPAWTVAAGSHRVRVVADSLARIAEPLEDNNSLERRFVILSGS